MALSVLMLAACKGNAEKKAESEAGVPHKTVVNPESQTAEDPGSFTALFTQYQHLSLALSSDNGQEAANSALSLLEALPKVDTAEFSAVQKEHYDALASSIGEHSRQISANPGNIALQRELLVSLSKDFLDIAKTFGTEKPLYKVFCPMYDNDRGAYWLSAVKEVKNPYFGQGMLQCGVIQEEIL